MRSAWRTVEKRCETRIVVQAARRLEDAVEDLGLAADVELRGGLVEQDDAGAALDREQRAGQRHPLPLAARKVGAALVLARQHGVERRRGRRGAGLRRAPRLIGVVGAPPRRGATLSRSDSS